jgi:hypothetical protein
MTSSASPSAAREQHQEVTRLLRSGDLRSAETLCNQLMARFPQYHPALHSASFLALCRGDVNRASELIGTALLYSPAEPRYLLQRARCLSAEKRHAEGVTAAGMAEENAAGDPQLLDAIGSFFSSVGEYSKALGAYSKAIALAPHRALYWFNRATVQRFVGRLEEAESDYDRVISLRPDDHEAYINRSELRKQTPERNHVQDMERMLCDGIRDWRGEVQVRYALAKEYEDLGKHSESWGHLVKGARVRREHLQYDVRIDTDTVDWIIKAFPAAPAAPVNGCDSREPIFIVGLPRSGTTLVERILGSHSQVLAAGELNHFAAALVAAALARTGGTPLPRRELVAATRELDFAALGADYLARTRPLTGARPHFTDKMPLNYLYCGLIRRALPNARIVHVTRHPMASCYAMFKTLFKDGYPFSYDLEEIAKYYAGYRRLMDHWRQTLPGHLYEIRYEQLVRDPEYESRRLLAACALEWEPGCLEFHRNPTATTTASASQVRQPLYDSSLAQWRHHEDALQGVRSLLLSAGIDAAELDP